MALGELIHNNFCSYVIHNHPILIMLELLTDKSEDTFLHTYRIFSGALD